MAKTIGDTFNPEWDKLKDLTSEYFIKASGSRVFVRSIFMEQHGSVLDGITVALHFNKGDGSKQYKPAKEIKLVNFLKEIEAGRIVEYSKAKEDEVTLGQKTVVRKFMLLEDGILAVCQKRILHLKGITINSLWQSGTKGRVDREKHVWVEDKSHLNRSSRGINLSVCEMDDRWGNDQGRLRWNTVTRGGADEIVVIEEKDMIPIIVEDKI